MKLKFKKPKSQLDEMQEQYLQKTGSIGFQIAYWGLLLLILVQFIIGADFKQVAGEYILYAILTVYGGFTSSKKGLWSRYFKPGLKSYILCGLCVGIIIGLFTFIMSIRFGAIRTTFIDTIVWSLGSAFSTFIGCLIWGGYYKYRTKKLEDSDDE